jgi:uncharacterized protein
LVFAISSARFDIANYLIEKGADVNFKDSGSTGKTPLLELLTLIDDSSKKEAYDESLRDIFPTRPEDMILPTITTIINKGAKLNVQDYDGLTPLMTAVRHCAPKSTQLLLEKGADVNIKDYQGKTALDHARENKTETGKKIVEMLLEKKAK